MKKVVVAMLSFSALALAGCADPEPVDITHTGALEESDPRVKQDNSPYDEYTLEAGKGWTINAQMTSTEFDSYLWLIGPGGTSVAQVDDTPQQGLNAHISHTTKEAGTYTLRANSRNEAGRGAYELHVSASPPDNAADGDSENEEP